MSQPYGVLLAVQEQFRHARTIGELLDKDPQTILNAISASGLKLAIDENAIAEDARAIYPFVHETETDWEAMYKFLDGEK